MTQSVKGLNWTEVIEIQVPPDKIIFLALGVILDSLDADKKSVETFELDPSS